MRFFAPCAKKEDTLTSGLTVIVIVLGVLVLSYVLLRFNAVWIYRTFDRAHMRCPGIGCYIPQGTSTPRCGGPDGMAGISF